ncbi:MAG: D-2-hydroxyacid dehydrogenase [Muribaculaceae bacterium]|nr:D-2-hydroxyacid dehydrogenase [Muribaculaceae bacterium]
MINLADKTRRRIVVLDGYVANSGDLSWHELEKFGELIIYERTSPAQVIDRCRGAFAVYVNKVILDAGILSLLPDLKFIGILATGYNNVDLEAARKYGKTVCNVPAYSTASVVQMAFALLLALTNRVETYSSSVARGEWTTCKDFSYRLTSIEELDGLTMGVYGLGNIGLRVASTAHAFGMRVVSFTSKRQEQLPDYIEKVSRDEMFGRSDVLSLNAPLADDNIHFVNAETLALMKPTAILINTARGGLVDEHALAEALRSKRIAAAGLDVLEKEPPAHDCPLIGLDNCIVTPHVAWQSTGARRRLLAISAENLAAFLSREPQNVVS